MKMPIQPKPAQRSEAVVYATTFYGLLGVAVGAGVPTIEQRFKELAEQHHPDKALAHAANRKKHVKCAIYGQQNDCTVCHATVFFARLTEARATLRDAKLRKAYDMKLQLGGLMWCERCRGGGYITPKLTGQERKVCPTCQGKGCK